MNEQTITVSQAARNLVKYVDRAHYQNVTYVLLKGGVPFARLVPEREKAFTGADLAEAVGKITVNYARS